MRGKLIFGLKLALSILLVVYLLREIDPRQVWEQTVQVDGVWLLAGFVLTLAQIVLCTARWRAVMAALGSALPWRSAFRLVYISIFFSQLLPGGVGGDAVRMWMTRKAGVGLRQTVNGVLLERAATLLMLLLLAAACLSLLAEHVPEPGLLVIFPLLALGGGAGIALLMVFDRLPPAWRGWRVTRGITLLAEDARLLFLRPRAAILPLALASLGHLNLTLTLYALGRGLGIQAGLADYLALIPPVILVMTLPISINGWGVRETAMVTALGFAGVPASSAFALSFLYGVLDIAASLPGGAIWLLSQEGKQVHLTKPDGPSTAVRRLT
jgi:uncharacterized membrane protein YbhN (UPF0104 family)